MRYKIVKFSALILFGIGLPSLKAQDAFPASGGNAGGDGGTVSYTIGQVNYTTNIGTNGSVVQGIQQSYEISVTTETVNATGINLICKAYPNPTTNFLILKIDNYEKENLLYQLYDINGKLLEINKIKGNETSISMEKFVSSTYFLKVTDNAREVKTFKIIKK
jgi:hypothetical protein